MPVLHTDLEVEAEAGFESSLLPASILGFRL